MHQDTNAVSENQRKTVSKVLERFSKTTLGVVASALLFCAWTARAESTAAITYEVDTSDLVHHHIVVTATIPPQAFPGKERLIALPVWTPGSYKIRDYSRFMGEVSLQNPGAQIRKVSKNRWKIEGLPANRAVKVKYEVYGHEISVRNNYFSPELSLLVGAATFVSPAPLNSTTGRRSRYQVNFPGWTRPIAGGLKEISGPAGVGFTASDYDELVDGPIVFGDLKIEKFQTQATPGRLVTGGDSEYWNSAPYLADVQKIVAATQTLWGEVPYTDYTFFNLLTGKSGGLEHRRSTVIMSDRFTTKERESYLSWLETMAHEHFHAWNVKHLHPKALGEFDYEKEVYTPSLWVAEGLTSYYDMLLLRRAGLCSKDEYVQKLADGLRTYLTTPGRRAITLSQASRDAWIRLYQGTDDLQNSNISYYQKGAIVGWLLDTKIRQCTGGKKSLDDLMRRAYHEFGREGYTPRQFQALASQVCGQDLTSFFALALDSTRDLPIDEALRYWGLKWEEKAAEPSLGVSTRSTKGRLYVDKVYADTPAYQAGLSSGDELLALDGNRLPADSLKMLKYLPETGKPHTVTISRMGKLKQLSFALSPDPFPATKLKPDPSQPDKSALRNSWLGTDDTSSNKGNGT